MEQIASNKLFGGWQNQYLHRSEVLNCDMQFSVYLPPQAETEKVPVLYWLSGLTCTDQNFVTKAGAQQYAAKHGIAIVCPDTSPRGEGVPDDPNGDWDFGLGAGFYVDATQPPWSEHYQVRSYVSEELSSLVNTHLNIDGSRTSLSGHSMGGHGALTIALTHPEKFKSVSAFSPIVSPINCPWGEKALRNYLGEDREAWKGYDSCELIRSTAQSLPMLIDQGEADNFLQEQLKTELLEKAAQESGCLAQIRYQPGYDHSYFFIASFIGEHIEFHSNHLK